MAGRPGGQTPHLRLAKWEAHPSANVEYCCWDGFDELRLAGETSPFCLNSILLVPELLSSEECQLLIDRTEERAQIVGSARKKTRMAILDRPEATGPGEPGGLGQEVEELWERAVNERVLPLMGAIPGCSELFRPECEHKTVEYDGLEPCINRYLAGGSFEKHRDEQMLTVICLLDDQGFKGGGTEYWAEVPGAGQVSGPPTLRLHPGRGVGVLFHGQLWHGGAPTTEGARYLLVASFDDGHQTGVNLDDN